MLEDNLTLRDHSISQDNAMPEDNLDHMIILTSGDNSMLEDNDEVCVDNSNIRK